MKKDINELKALFPDGDILTEENIVHLIDSSHNDLNAQPMPSIELSAMDFMSKGGNLHATIHGDFNPQTDRIYLWQFKKSAGTKYNGRKMSRGWKHLPGYIANSAISKHVDHPRWYNGIVVNASSGKGHRWGHFANTEWLLTAGVTTYNLGNIYHQHQPTRNEHRQNVMYTAYSVVRFESGMDAPIFGPLSTIKWQQTYDLEANGGVNKLLRYKIANN